MSRSVLRRLPLAATLLLVAGWSAAAAQNLTFTPYHANGIYAVGERVGWNVSLPAGATAATGRYTYVVKRDGEAAIAKGSFDMAAGKATIQTSLAQPGMVLVEVRPPAGVTGFHGASKTEVDRVLLGAAVSPLRIKPSYPRPADFDSFWTAQLKALSAIPPEPVVKPGESGKPGVEWYTVRLNNIKRGHVYGQLARPAGEGKHPALLILQWAGGPYPLDKSWVTERAAEGWLVLDVEPHDVPPDMPQAFYDNLPQLLKEYNTIGQNSREDSWFLQMYLGDYRAAEYLASRSDWDGKTLVVMGTSMGGQQSFAVAGLNPRITAMLVNVPSGADVLGPLHGRAAPYPNWYIKRADVRKTAQYFDDVNFASRIHARALVGLGFIDETSIPAGIYAAYNLIPGPKEVVPMPDSPHNHMATPEEQAPIVKRTEEWLRMLVKGEAPTVAAAAPAAPAQVRAGASR